MAAKYLTMVGQLNGWSLWGDLTSMLKWQPCQGSELLLDKGIRTDSKGSTHMPSGPRIMQLGLELINLITPSYQIKV